MRISTRRRPVTPTSGTSIRISGTWRSVPSKLDDGTWDQVYNGRSRKWRAKNFQVVGSAEVLADVGVKGAGAEADIGGQRGPNRGAAPIPGSLLTKLNPLKSLDAEGRREFAEKYRALQEFLDNPDDRLAVMDSQGIEATVNFATLPGLGARVRGRL